MQLPNGGNPEEGRGESQIVRFRDLVFSSPSSQARRALSVPLNAPPSVMLVLGFLLLTGS